MNLLDEKKLAAEVVNPALDRIQQQIIPALEAALLRVVSSAVNGFGAAGLDGFVLEIEIPKITIRLTRDVPKLEGIKGC